MEVELICPECHKPYKYGFTLQRHRQTAHGVQAAQQRQRQIVDIGAIIEDRIIRDAVPNNPDEAQDDEEVAAPADPPVDYDFEVNLSYDDSDSENEDHFPGLSYADDVPDDEADVAAHDEPSSDDIHHSDEDLELSNDGDNSDSLDAASESSNASLPPLIPLQEVPEDDSILKLPCFAPCMELGHLNITPASGTCGPACFFVDL